MCSEITSGRIYVHRGVIFASLKMKGIYFISIVSNSTPVCMQLIYNNYNTLVYPRPSQQFLHKPNFYTRNINPYNHYNKLGNICGTYTTTRSQFLCKILNKIPPTPFYQRIFHQVIFHLKKYCIINKGDSAGNDFCLNHQCI